MATPLKFYTDVHIAKTVVRQLRNKGIDILHGGELGLGDATDFEHLHA
jgi:predicted nuclease of predicted toxin-antitoxin system